MSPKRREVEGRGDARQSARRGGGNAGGGSQGEGGLSTASAKMRDERGAGKEEADVEEEQEEEEEGFLNLTPSILQRQSAARQQVVKEKSDNGEQRADGGKEPRAATHPMQRERVGLWAGGKSEQWWNPVDLQTGTQDTQYYDGLERERQKLYKEYREHQEYQDELYGNLTAAEYEKLDLADEREIRAIERASLLDLEHSISNETGKFLLRQAPVAVDPERNYKGAAEVDATFARMQRDQPAKVYANLAESLVDFCGNYLMEHGTEEEKKSELVQREAKEGEYQKFIKEINAKAGTVAKGAEGGGQEEADADDQSRSVEIEYERDDVTLFKARPTPRQQRRLVQLPEKTPAAHTHRQARVVLPHTVPHPTPSYNPSSSSSPLAAAAAGGVGIGGETPAWKRVGRGKRELRARKAVTRRDALQPADTDGLAELCQTPPPPAARCFVCVCVAAVLRCIAHTHTHTHAHTYTLTCPPAACIVV